MSSPENKPDGSLRGQGRFLQALQENGIDSSRMIFWNPFAPLENPKKGSILVIFDVIPLKFPSHFPAGVRGNIQLWKNKRAVKKFDTIVTISEHAKTDIIQYLGISDKKIKVIYPPLGKVFLKKYGSLGVWGIGREGLGDGEIGGQGKKYMIYVGDVNWNKNLPNLARALKLGNIPCIFVGKEFVNGDVRGLEHPWKKSFKEFLEIAKGDPKFIFKGYVSDEELIFLYKNAVCNVLISQDEGFGYSYVEAGSQETPSVLSDTEIFMETGGDSALFANPNKPEEIAQKIQMFVEDVKLRDEMGKKAKARILELFSPEKFTSAHQALLAGEHIDRS